MTKGAAVKEKAKELAQRHDERDDVHILSTGVRVRLKPVSGSLIEDLRSAIPDPIVPTWYNEDKDREEENPNDPEYLAAVERVKIERGQARIDAIVLFGVELIDGVPEDDTWLRSLRLLERRGILDLAGFDLDDDFDREFLYKKYVAVAQPDYSELSMLTSSIPASEVRRARRSFLGSETRATDRELPDQRPDSDGD